MTTISRSRMTVRATVFAAIAALALSACASDDAAEETTAAAEPTSDHVHEVTFDEAWVKVVDEGMTAAFGELHNGTHEEIVFVSASTPVSSMVELHETTMDDGGDMMMSAKEGGFAVGEGETLTLEPGGNHIMLMDVTEPIEAGDVVTLTLTFESGDTLDVEAVAKEFSGANEEYSGDDEMSHDHGDSMDEDHSTDHSTGTDH
ncbi:copper chaperone PCu(A)C [Demequina sediminicola]|uniref:copper chaperone PCu(A)C n=1 Tax=Demequina sediminicola TaxID=1095026 RepID=UPI0009E30A52|nr:copper chaperone PCu(A)C [Demequina sediminicola]